jgi:hypothetical protein
MGVDAIHDHVVIRAVEGHVCDLAFIEVQLGSAPDAAHGRLPNGRPRRRPVVERLGAEA